MAKTETVESIEKTLDTIEETIDTIERIPKVNLNGTTKKQQYIILAVTAVVSAAVAGGAVHVITKKRLTTKYDKLMADEIEETKRYYSRLHKTDEFSDPESALATLAPEVEVPKVDPNKGLVEQREQYVNQAKALKYTRPGESPAPSEKDLIKEVADKVDEIPQKVKHVFDDQNSSDGWSYEAEQSKRDARPLDPHVVHFDEFMENPNDYPQVTLTYFEGDDVLIDEQEKIINETDAVVGDDNLAKFGYGSKDPNVVYVLNPSQDILFEVNRSTGTYAQEVAGIQHADERPGRRKQRRFRLDSDDE